MRPSGGFCCVLSPGGEGWLRSLAKDGGGDCRSRGIGGS